MASVTGMTAAAIDEELDKMIVGLTVDPETGQIFALPRNGDPISAGSIVSPTLAVEAAYPVGSIYFNGSSSTNPATLLGVGTWVRFGKGRTIVSLDEEQTEFDSLGETGGAKTHTLSVGEMPAHTHGIAHTHTMTLSYNTADTDNDETNQRITSLNWGTGFDIDRTGTTSAASTPDSSSVGGGGAHNNLQPYVVVYVWRRTA